MHPQEGFSRKDPEAGKVCALCGGEPVLTACAGCGRLLCEKCSRFELVGSGCGCVWPIWYCPDCASDYRVNPNALLRDPW